MPIKNKVNALQPAEYDVFFKPTCMTFSSHIFLPSSFQQEREKEKKKEKKNTPETSKKLHQNQGFSMV